MKSYKEWLKGLIPFLGQKAVDELAGELEAAAAGVPEAWQVTILALLADAVKEHGPDGVAIATEAVMGVLDGKVGIVFDWTNLRTASDLLAQMQNAEADKAVAAEKFMVTLQRLVEVVLTALFKALV